jgi:hypothetical protein
MTSAQILTLGLLPFYVTAELCAQWESLDGGTSFQVRSFLVDSLNDRLIVGGSFPYVADGTLRANNLAWWDGTQWGLEGLGNGTGDTSEFGQISNPVQSMVRRNDTLFVSYLGNYWHYSFDMRFATMLVDGTWYPCGQPNGIFYFLEAQGRMFSGGVHDTLYGAYAPGIHEWVGGEFRDMPNSPFVSQVQVNAVEYWHDRIYFGGLFDVLGSPRIVSFDGTDQWAGVGNGVGGYYIATLCGYGDSLYAGGYLQNGPNVQSQHIQLFDGEAWRPFFQEVEFQGFIWDIQVHDGALYVSGLHTWVGDNVPYTLLRYDGHTLCSLGGPNPSGNTLKMAFYHGSLYQSIEDGFPGLENQFIGRLPLDGLVPDRCADVASGLGEQAIAPMTLRVFPAFASSLLANSAYTR